MATLTATLGCVDRRASPACQKSASAGVLAHGDLHPRREAEEGGNMFWWVAAVIVVAAIAAAWRSDDHDRPKELAGGSADHLLLRVILMWLFRR